MIAIHKSNHGFQLRWRNYCKTKNIPFKDVDCYADDLVEQLKGCTALMWHYVQADRFARGILDSLEMAGVIVFPNHRTAWCFDDKLSQKYLFEALHVDFAKTWVFYSRKDAESWAEKCRLPVVFKLSRGAGSENVKLVHTKHQVKKLIKKAFSKGFYSYDAWGSFKERMRKYRVGIGNLFNVFKGFVRLVVLPKHVKQLGREVDYVYFQEFIPNNTFDTRVVVVNKRAFAIKRFNRKGDFRASGSGRIEYDRELFDIRCIKIAFDITLTIESQSAAYDFIFDKDGKPVIVEVSHGFTPEGYDECTGYWKSDLSWHEEKFDPYGWMVDDVLNLKNNG